MRIRKAKVKSLVKLYVDKDNNNFVAVIFKWPYGSYLRNFDVRDKDDSMRLLKLLEWAGVSHLADLEGQEFRLITSKRLVPGLGGRDENQYITDYCKAMCTTKNEILLRIS